MDGPVISLALTSARRIIISITNTKSSGEIIHPNAILMSIFNFCHLVEYLLLENLTYVHLKYADKRFLMSSGIKNDSIAFSSIWCLTEPYAFSKSNQMTWSSNDLLFWAVSIVFYSVPQHSGMFNTTWKAWNSSFLYWCVDITIVYHESRHPLRKDTEKDLTLYDE